MRKISPQAILIFLTTQDEQELIERLEERKTETRESMKTRIETARQELAHTEEFDYVVLNRNCHLDEAVDSILDIIQSEHQRAIPRKVTL